MRSQFTFYRSFYEAVKELPARAQTEVIMAICGYALDGTEPRLSGTAKAIFSLIRPTLDAAERKSAGRRREDTAKIGERCGEDHGKEKEKEKEKEVEKEIEIEVEGEIEIEKEKENECSISLSEKESEKKRFRQPTVEEVEAYCRERGNKVDARAFVDFYASKGWKVGRDTIKDWRAAVRTWERRLAEDARSHRKQGLSMGEKMQVLQELRDEYRGAGV